MNTTIKLDYKLGKFKAKLFALCGLSVKNMTFLFLGIWIAQQLISVSIEYLIWGEHFPHVFDSIFSIVLSIAYFHYTYALGDFLLDLILNGSKENP